MNIKGLIVISMLILIPNWSCEKKGDLIELHFNETGCSNPWSVSNNDSDYQNKVKSYLEQHDIEVKYISISNDGPISGCESCLCTTGRRINITIYESDKHRALELGFFL